MPSATKRYFVASTQGKRNFCYENKNFSFFSEQFNSCHKYIYIYIYIYFFFSSVEFMKHVAYAMRADICVAAVQI